MGRTCVEAGRACGGLWHDAVWDGGEQGFRVQGIMTMSNTVLVIAAGMVMMTVIIVVSGFSDSGPFLSFQILVMTRESGRPEGRIPKPILNIEIRKCFLNPKP